MTEQKQAKSLQVIRWEMEVERLESGIKRLKEEIDSYRENLIGALDVYNLILFSGINLRIQVRLEIISDYQYQLEQVKNMLLLAEGLE